MAPSKELLHGTLDVLILKAVRDTQRHGYGIVRHIAEFTGAAVAVEDGSLYPALYRLEKKGQIKGSWGITDEGRRARYYRLTARGQKALAEQTRQWERFASGISRLLLGDGK